MNDLQVNPNLKERMVVKQRLLDDGEKFLAEHPKLDEPTARMIVAHNKLLAKKRDRLAQQLIADSMGLDHGKSLSP